MAATLLFVSCGHRRMTALKQPAALPAYAQNINKQIINAVDAGDGDYELRLLRARLDKNPGDLTTRLELARRYQHLGFMEVAIEHCRLACERAPGSEEAHTALARTLRDAARSPEATAVLNAYTDGHPAAGASVWAWLGLLRDDSGDWKAGESAHRRALAIEPGRDEFHNNLGYCLLRQGRHEEAADEFRAALKLQPHSVIAENNLGMALAGRSGTNSEAVAHLQSVADPASAHNNMAVALLEEGRYAEARQEIDVALRYNQAHTAALSNLGLLADLDGRAAELPRSERSNQGRWARAVRGWHRLWSGAVGGVGTSDSVGPVASR